MPYMSTIVESELVTTHAGIDVYYIYKNDDVDNGASVLWYTTDIYGVKNGNATFDIREVYTKLQVEYPGKVFDITDIQNHEVIIGLAIDIGIIKDLSD